MESIVFPGFDFPMTARAALLVIDMQPCGVGAEAGLVKAIESTAPGYTKYLVDRVERVVIPNIRRLAETVRGHGRPVYFTAFASAAGDGSDVATSTIRYRDAQRRAGRPTPRTQDPRGAARTPRPAAMRGRRSRRAPGHPHPAAYYGRHREAAP
jgi:nicotinamidase-related amidase